MSEKSWIETPWGRITVYLEPSLPQNTLLVLGSCGCHHPIRTHGPDGCSADPCDCTTPMSRLVTKVQITPDEHEGH